MTGVFTAIQMIRSDFLIYFKIDYVIPALVHSLIYIKWIIWIYYGS